MINTLLCILLLTQPPATLPTGDALTKHAGALMEQWYPIVWNLLGTQDSKPVSAIKVTFQLKQDAPAYATGGGIFVSVPWVRAHPGSRTTPGWLVEGIADYIRWWRYEPEAPRPRITEINKYDHGLVQKPDKAMKTRSYNDSLFETATGKKLDDLWAEFVAYQTKPKS